MEYQPYSWEMKNEYEFGSAPQTELDIFANKLPDNEKIFTPATSWAFMLFVLLYFPCVATVQTLKKEVGIKWASFVVVNSLVLAWVMAFIAFRILS